MNEDAENSKTSGLCQPLSKTDQALNENISKLNFRWIKQEVFMKIDWLNLNELDTTQYIVECDIVFSKKDQEYLGDKTLSGISRETDSMIHGLDNRHMLNHHSLKFYLEHGLILNRIHRVGAYDLNT